MYEWLGPYLCLLVTFLYEEALIFQIFHRLKPTQDYIKLFQCRKNHTFSFNCQICLPPKFPRPPIAIQQLSSSLLNVTIVQCNLNSLRKSPTLNPNNFNVHGCQFHDMLTAVSNAQLSQIAAVIIQKGRRQSTRLS